MADRDELSTPLLVNRARLHAALRPEMKPASFDNWLSRAIRHHGFPPPIRIGARSASWLFTEVQAWLASRPRGGVFMGRRRAR